MVIGEKCTRRCWKETCCWKYTIQAFWVNNDITVERADDEALTGRILQVNFQGGVHSDETNSNTYACNSILYTLHMEFNRIRRNETLRRADFEPKTKNK